MPPSRCCPVLLLLLLSLSSLNALPPPSLPLSLPLMKALTPPLHRHRVGHHWPHRTRAFGSLFATYLATVSISGDPFTCILDTGSSDFAVAASLECGCDVFYGGECDSSPTAPRLSVRYGDGNWTGLACTDSVAINGVELGDVTFAGMKQQTSMLECDAAHQQNGIIGLAFPGLLGPPANYTLPFFDLFTQRTHRPAVFALQCCGWQNDSSQEYNAEYAQGALDLGGVNRDHVHGEVFYTPITERLFYAVDLLDIRVNGVSTMPTYRRPANAQYRRRHRKRHHGHSAGHQSSEGVKVDPEKAEEGQSEGADLQWAELPFPPQTIVDSGTSNLVSPQSPHPPLWPIFRPHPSPLRCVSVSLLAVGQVFTPDIFNRTVAQIQRHVTDQPDSVWDGEECVHHSDDGTDVTSAWPTLTLVLAGEEDEPPFALDIPPCRYLAKAPAKECKDGVAGHAFAIESAQDEGIILGQVVYESFYVVHDNERNRVGFGQLEGCESDIECLEEVAVGEDDVLVRAKVAVDVERQQVEALEGQVGAQDAGVVELEAVGQSDVWRQWRWGWSIAAIALFVLWRFGWRRLMQKPSQGYEAIAEGDDEVDVISG